MKVTTDRVIIGGGRVGDLARTRAAFLAEWVEGAWREDAQVRDLEGPIMSIALATTGLMVVTAPREFRGYVGHVALAQTESGGWDEEHLSADRQYRGAVVNDPQGRVFLHDTIAMERQGPNTWIPTTIPALDFVPGASVFIDGHDAPLVVGPRGALGFLDADAVRAPRAIAEAITADGHAVGNGDLYLSGYESGVGYALIRVSTASGVLGRACSAASEVAALDAGLALSFASQEDVYAIDASGTCLTGPAGDDLSGMETAAGRVADYLALVYAGDNKSRLVRVVDGTVQVLASGLVSDGSPIRRRELCFGADGFLSAPGWRRNGRGPASRW